MSNLIVRADKEVFLATNYWLNSVASAYITNAMKELSRRAGARGERVVMKLMYDRGSPKQLIDNHYIVPQSEYLGKAVALPAPEDIPNIDLQVMNYHRPMLGTFHCKYMVVDRKYAVLQSNNIQDNDNVEMMIHLEGPIVDSLYDMALISWNLKLDPPLPSHNSPAASGGIDAFTDGRHNGVFDSHGAIKGHSAIVHPDKFQQREAYSHSHTENAPQERRPTHELGSDDAVLTGPTSVESTTHPVEQYSTEHPQVDDREQGDNDLGQQGTTSTAAGQRLAESGMSQKETTYTQSNPPSTTNSNAQPSPHENVLVGQGQSPPGPDATTQAFLGGGQQGIPESQIKNPNVTDHPLPEHTTDDPHYDVDIADEVARVQASVSPKQGETRVEAVTRHLNHTKNIGFKGDAPECQPDEEMTPYIPHPTHEPFPIALVCREPYGSPNHHSVYNPQNEVWLSALRNAKKNVFIQSPTLNAEPLIPAIIEACERGIDVYCYICLGYNDTVRSFPVHNKINHANNTLGGVASDARWN